MGKRSALLVGCLLAGCAGAPRGAREAPGMDVGLIYREVVSLDDVQTEVALELDYQRPRVLGRFGGSCSVAEYERAYQGHVPERGLMVFGTVCYLGGASVIVITRDGEDLVASESGLSDAAAESPGALGEAGPVPASPWRELARVRIGRSSRLRVRGDARGPME